MGPAEDRFLWRSTAEATALRDFLSDTDWGELDYLVVDLAPGTG
ncbi:MAG: P-loop NTPase [Gammaproteobacteria bacterium]|nr:Mrp/NBP35 family ATP-binding protein [Gemmatimonadota bacterium]NIU80113.1 P-loop NTPase [Gammaproteobacteria bacterium]NIX25622.1 P-loop NTPase [Actinomycetota bacterium]